jgi:hypothetical protein
VAINQENQVTRHKQPFELICLEDYDMYNVSQDNHEYFIEDFLCLIGTSVSFAAINLSCYKIKKYVCGFISVLLI